MVVLPPVSLGSVVVCPGWAGRFAGADPGGCVGGFCPVGATARGPLAASGGWAAGFWVTAGTGAPLGGCAASFDWSGRFDWLP
jgi:hypothetical protein